ncbi:MAG: flavodoxin family protein [Hamadaea sp.]|nr:flavodoxin family protein [Hamadaea sp.]
MSALVVYESMFGNTRAVAQAVADGLAAAGEVTICEVSAAPPDLPETVDLLVLGGPTHAHGLSRPQSREAAKKETPQHLVSNGIGIREWLAALPKPAPSVRVAAFDTRFAKPRWITGSAAATITKLARRAGLSVPTEPESFFVDHTLGPLQDGETARARRWGASLIGLGSTQHTTPVP